MDTIYAMKYVFVILASLLLVYLLHLTLGHKPQRILLGMRMDDTQGGMVLKQRKLTVTNLIPKPNYDNRDHTNAYANLVDGVKGKHPIWKYSNNVGWAGKTPVTIDLAISVPEDSQNYRRALLEIHTARKESADVSLPHRIDVYSQINDRYLHVGQLVMNNDEFTDASNHTLQIPISGFGKMLRLVVHAKNRYIMLDELSLYVTPTIAARPVAANIFNMKPKNHSSNLLKKQLGAKKPVSVNRFKKLCYQWLDPYEVNLYESLDACDSPKSVVFSGYRNEWVAKILAVHNGSNNQKSFWLKKNDKSLTVKIIGQITAADGSTVFDPLIPIEKPLVIQPGETAFLWLSTKLSSPLTNSEVNLDVFVGNQVFSHIVVKNNINEKYNVNRLPAPNVIVWAYLSDLPIWKNPKKNLNDLQDHGVNVFVVHQANMPALGRESFGTYSRRQNLVNSLKLYKGKGTVLLYTAWQGKKYIKDQDASIRKLWIERYIRELSQFMVSQDYSFDEWAIYPFDESDGKGINVLIDVASIIKKTLPVRIYANPSTNRTNPLSAKSILQLRGLVDIIQPSFRSVNSVGADVFKSLDAEFWIYDNPKSPAKSASPLHYRQIANKAIAEGATGFGFWSYSDTARSSAWDDFDGIRPDWSVVYEGASKPVSSRRWEAFRDGIEDYQLLQAR